MVKGLFCIVESSLFISVVGMFSLAMKPITEDPLEASHEEGMFYPKRKTILSTLVKTGGEVRGR